MAPSRANLLDEVHSKRTMLQAIASIIDPLGFFQPVLLPAKLLLQKAWLTQSAWDEKIHEDLKTEWESVAQALPGLFQHKVQRYVGEVNEKSMLLVFSDASAKAYAAAVYLRCQDADGNVTCNLIFAKSRLAPKPGKKKSHRVQKITLPRLELLGQTLGTRAGQFCREALGTHIPIKFFCDSEIVLHWIRSAKTLQRFVANRVAEIRKVENCTFHYVSTNDNPSDYGTRGKTAEELVDDPKWWYGPPWAVKTESDWPETRLESVSDETLREIEAEVKETKVCQTLVVKEAEKTASDRFLDIDYTKYSSFGKLVRVSVLCLKFLKQKVWKRLSADSQDRFPRIANLFGKISENPELDAEEF